MKSFKAFFSDLKNNFASHHHLWLKALVSHVMFFLATFLTGFYLQFSDRFIIDMKWLPSRFLIQFVLVFVILGLIARYRSKTGLAIGTSLLLFSVSAVTLGISYYNFLFGGAFLNLFNRTVKALDPQAILVAIPVAALLWIVFLMLSAEKAVNANTAGARNQARTAEPAVEDAEVVA